MSGDIRFRVDNELTKRVGTWFTVREIQETLRINPATLKPLLMKYARENLLRRRHVKGTARSVQFTPAAPSKNSFSALILKNMPYRQFTSPPSLKAAATKTAATKIGAAKKGVTAASKKATKVSSKKTAPKKSTAKTLKKSTKKTTTKSRW